MKPMMAKYAGRCSYQHLTHCEGIKPGEAMVFAGKGKSWHQKCGPTGVDPQADREYMAGQVDYRRWKDNVSMFGEEAAAAVEIELDMRFGDY